MLMKVVRYIRVVYLIRLEQFVDFALGGVCNPPVSDKLGFIPKRDVVMLLYNQTKKIYVCLGFHP